MLYVVLFILSWGAWLFFADRKRWRELFPVSIFASFLGSVTDNIMHYYKLWEFHSEHPLLPRLLDDLGIYMVLPYLFIQLLPKRRTLWIMLAYWVIWTGFAIGLEWVHLVTNHMEHHLWWNLWYSYAADWFLFWLFYHFHRIFQLSRLYRPE
ncbi:MAG: hypothetical protein VR68_00510 [Peptococcaceae bacterium BRH_c4a]|nr:MAG: hypothetical protein VR68_00510 [Peptococcaceae bacterium BRH_c4a]